jgi:hypothetical protein
MKLILKPPGTKRFKLKCDKLLSTFAFKNSLRRYTKEGVKPTSLRVRTSQFKGVSWHTGRGTWQAQCKVGRCRLTVSKPEFKVGLVSALETKM